GVSFPLFEGLGLEACAAFTSGLFFPVLAYPGFPAFAGGGIAAGEGKSGNIGVSDLLTLVGIFRQDAHEGGSERRASGAIKDVAFYLLAVFGGYGDVAAVIEGF